MTLQFIHRWTYEAPVDILEDFDFTICCSCVYFDDQGAWNGVAHDLFYQDLAAKRLRYLHPERAEDAGGSALRVLKYYQKGYRITLKSYAGVIARLVKGVRDVDRMGEDFLTEVVTGLLVEVDPSAIEEEPTTM